jgi:hypothetical protein
MGRGNMGKKKKKKTKTNEREGNEIRHVFRLL